MDLFKQIKNKYKTLFFLIKQVLNPDFYNTQKIKKSILKEYISIKEYVNSVFLKKDFRKKSSDNYFIDQISFVKVLGLKQKKSFILFFSALFVSIMSFYFMSVLISTGKNPKWMDGKNISIEFLLNIPIDELELRSRRLLKKPTEEEAPPDVPKLKVQSDDIEKPDLQSHLPQLELPDDYQSDSQGGAVASGQAYQDRDVTPIFRINPIYPRRAALQNIEGFVILQFDITETGQTDNISVIQASPPQIFNSNAIQALRKWKYKPRIENGRAVRQKALKVQLDFNLTN